MEWEQCQYCRQDALNSSPKMPLTISNKVAAVYEDVRNDKTDTNWCILGYTDDKGEALDLVSQGMIFNRQGWFGRIQKEPKKGRSLLWIRSYDCWKRRISNIFNSLDALNLSWLHGVDQMSRLCVVESYQYTFLKSKRF